MIAVEVVGWVFVALPILTFVYAYALYPLILRILPKRIELRRDAAEWPTVTIVVPAYNEEHQIHQTLEALIAQDYPSDRRQILVLSDASTDRTDEIVREYADRGVELLRMAPRGGKTAAE